MTVPDTTTVEAQLARLDTETLGSLVADAWVARGFEVERDGDVLVATRDGATATLWVVGGRKRWWRRGVTMPEREVDVVVAPGAGERVRTAAGDRGARFVDATGLWELLWYGVDRPTATAICERYLGAPPESLRPPLTVRARRRLDAVERPTSGTTFVAAVVVLAVLLVAAGVGPASLWPGQADTAGSDDFDNFRAETGLDEPPGRVGTAPFVTTAESAAGRSNDSNVSSIPGLTADGIVDLTALASAHERAVTNRSYTLWLDVYEPQDGDPTGPRVQRDIDITVEGDRYFLVTETEVDGNRTRIGSVYHEGETWFVREPDGANETSGTWRRVAAEDAAALGPNPFVLGRTGVSQFLSTPESTVTGRVDEGGRTLYRVVGRGPPEGPFSGQMTNYTVVALVDPTGFVVDLTVDYTVATSGQPSRIRLEWTYGRLGATTVDAPPGDGVPAIDG
jgi:hypothetical protein